ncbi:MAG: tetratricopeptide repeat protein [Pseudomonadales bacterium]|nr:tetratricopeptide repeat protein [Pseudomonadales bacterium]
MRLMEKVQVFVHVTRLAGLVAACVLPALCLAQAGNLQNVQNNGAELQNSAEQQSVQDFRVERRRVLEGGVIMDAPSVPITILGDESKMLARGRTRTARSIEDYRRAIEVLENVEGPYASGLAGQFSGLGGLLESTGEYQAAISAYEKALHVVRVNYGLFAAEQPKLVMSLIRNHVFLRNFEEARRQEDFLRYLRDAGYRREFPQQGALQPTAPAQQRYSEAH